MKPKSVIHMAIHVDPDKIECCQHQAPVVCLVEYMVEHAQSH